MKNPYKLLIVTAALWLPINAGAETTDSSPKPELVIGSIIPGDVGISASGTAYGFTINASLDYEFKNGLFAGIAYPSYTEHGSANELLVGYGSLSYDKVKATATITDGSNNVAVNGSAAVKGDIKALAAIYSWKTSHDGLYFGGGLGAAVVNDKITSIGGDANISGKETGVVPVGAVQAGYRMSGKDDNPINVDVSYRYLYFLSGRNGLDNLTANSVFVNLSIPF